MTRALALALLALTLVAAPANAVDPDADPRPTINYSLRDRLPGRGTMMVIDAPANDRGVTRFAWTTARAVPGLRVRVGNCADYPRLACVKVIVRKFDDEAEMHRLCECNHWWAGLTTYASRKRRVIRLNTTFELSYAIAAHEFAHALGMGHHRKWGVLGRTGDKDVWSRREIGALRNYYG